MIEYHCYGPLTADDHRSKPLLRVGTFCGMRVWYCIGRRTHGIGTTPRQAYEAWR